jgi:hypothetical protein
MELQLPKIGDVAFEQAWGDLVCQAVLVEVEELESYAQGRILQNGTARWSSPRVETNDGDLSFGTWADGNGLPVLFDDIDGDGQVEMVAMVPKADMTPTRYRIFRWDGHSLMLLRRASLVRQEGGEFRWTEVDPEDESPKIWVDYFEGHTAHLVQRRRATYSRSSMQVKSFPDGFLEVC